MNRIIIVGNGFDLAHGLKTKYEDFINWYWGKWLNRLKNSTTQCEEDSLCEISVSDKYKKKKSTLFEIFNYNLLYIYEDYRLSFVYNTDHFFTLKYKSVLFENICKMSVVNGWVDIECAYYELLKSCDDNRVNLIKLNKDFAVIQDLLIEYLNEINKADIYDKILTKQIRDKILSPFFAKEIGITANSIWQNFAVNRVNGNKNVYSQHLKEFEYENVDCDYLNEIGHQEYSNLVDGKKVSDDIGHLLF